MEGQRRSAGICPCCLSCVMLPVVPPRDSAFQRNYLILHEWALNQSSGVWQFRRRDEKVPTFLENFVVLTLSSLWSS